MHVRFEERTSGGIEIGLRSRVELYYGEVIRQQVRDVLRALGVEHASIEIVDEGALPFVIAARIEAAVRRAGLAPGKPALPEAVTLAAPSPRDRLRRSRLYLPGNEPKYFVNAGLHGPDAVILDLEDSVHYAEKDAARLLVRNALRAVDFGAARAHGPNQSTAPGIGRPGRDRSAITRSHPDSESRDRRPGIPRRGSYRLPSQSRRAPRGPFG